MLVGPKNEVVAVSGFAVMDGLVTCVGRVGTLRLVVAVNDVGAGGRMAFTVRRLRSL